MRHRQGFHALPFLGGESGPSGAPIAPGAPLPFGVRAGDRGGRAPWRSQRPCPGRRVVEEHRPPRLGVAVPHIERHLARWGQFPANHWPRACPVGWFSATTGGGEARVEVVGKPRDRAAPARRIAPLEVPPEFLPPLPAPKAGSREARPATAPRRPQGRGGPSCGDGVMRYRSRAGYRGRGSVRARHIAASPGLEPGQARRFQAPFLWV